MQRRRGRPVGAFISTLRLRHESVLYFHDGPASARQSVSRPAQETPPIATTASRADVGRGTAIAGSPRACRPEMARFR